MAPQIPTWDDQGAWRMTCGYPVFVDKNERVLRGTRSLVPYRRTPSGEWEPAVGIKLETLRRGMLRGTHRLM